MHYPFFGTGNPLTLISTLWFDWLGGFNTGRLIERFEGTYQLRKVLQ
jgi:hypothetical protein